MSKLVLLRGLSTDLDSNSLVDGQILFTKDTNELYIDFLNPETEEVIRKPITDKKVANLLQQHIESLNKVENKSSEEIRDEITYENVINALGYVPTAGAGSTFNASSIVYNNTESGLTGENVQAALDEVVEKNAVNQINILALQESTKNVVEGNENEIDKIWKTDENGVPGWREAASDEVTVDREIHTPIFPTKWNILEGSNTAPVLECVSSCYGQGKIIAVGYEMGYYSTDNGITWNIINELSNSDNLEVIYANDRFVCIGTNGISFYSLDGISWNEMTGLDTSDDYNYYYYNNLIYGKDKFMCTCGELPGTIYYSTNGTTWNKKIIDENKDPVSILGYGKDKFICFFNNQLYYSTDGITWTQGDIVAPDDWYCITISYGNNQFITVFCQDISDEATLYFSNDGVTWTTNENLSLDNGQWNENFSFDNINYYTDRYIANTNNQIFYSLNGVSWFTMPGTNDYEYGIDNVIFNEQEKTLIAIGEDYIYYLIDEREEITYEQETLKVSELALELYNNRTPLYDTTGDNTDGAMTQAAVTALVGDIGSILDEINRTEV